MVLHVPRSSPSALPRILDRTGALPAHAAVGGEPLQHGHVYVAPADRHLLAIDNRIRLSSGPTENGHRPAIDPLFRSLARAFGPRAVGVVLSGARDDGAAGLATIAARGGLTVVQDPTDALYPSMPRAALEQVTPDHIVSAAKMGSILAEITTLTLPPAAGQATDPLLNAEVAMSDLASLTSDELPGDPAGYGCPSCGGALFELDRVPVPRYRCRIGHAWSPDSLLDEQAIALEGAMWMALRALEEKSELSRRMAMTRPQAGTARAERHRGMADEAGELIRGLIEKLAVNTDPDRPRSG